MRDAHRIAGISLSATSTDPLRGIVDVDIADSTIRFALDEDIANRICTLLDRFLTLGQKRKPNQAE